MREKAINISDTEQDTCPGIFKNVFGKYFPPLCFFAERLIQNRQDAEDIVEDTFIKLWQKQPDFSKHKNLKALLYLSVKNNCINHLKKMKRKAAGNSQLSYLLESKTEDFILNEIVRVELLHNIMLELQKLPPERRTVMHLLFVEGWDSEKVAKFLEISVHTVKKHKLKGIHDLRNKFGLPQLTLLGILSHL